MIADFDNGWEAQWPTGYTENFVVSESQFGISEDQVVKACIEPYANPNGNAVEIGCGTGNAWSKKHLAKRFRYATGVDVIRREWVIAKDDPKNFSYLRVSPYDFTLSMIEDCTVDFVWSFGCLGHLPRAAIRQYLDSAYRVLKKGGNAAFEFFATTRRFPKAYSDDEPVTLGKPGTFVLDETEPKLMIEHIGFSRVVDNFPTAKTVLLTAYKAK